MLPSRSKHSAFPLDSRILVSVNIAFTSPYGTLKTPLSASRNHQPTAVLLSEGGRSVGEKNSPLRCILFFPSWMALCTPLQWMFTSGDVCWANVFPNQSLVKDSAELESLLETIESGDSETFWLSSLTHSKDPWLTCQTYPHFLEVVCHNNEIVLFKAFLAFLFICN